jgi:hypothetical protein
MQDPEIQKKNKRNKLRKKRNPEKELHIFKQQLPKNLEQI